MTPEQRSVIAAALSPYGAHLTSDDHIARGEKVTGIRLEVRKGRLRMLGGEHLYASYPAARAAAGVANFVEKFWYWKPAAGNRTRTRTRYGNAIRVRFPGIDKTEFDPHTNKHLHIVRGEPRKRARKHKAEEIRRVRRMIARAKPGSEEQKRLRIYLAVLIRKAGGKGSRYAVDEKTPHGRLPHVGRNWREVPD